MKYADSKTTSRYRSSVFLPLQQDFGPPLDRHRVAVVVERSLEGGGGLVRWGLGPAGRIHCQRATRKTDDHFQWRIDFARQHVERLLRAADVFLVDTQKSDAPQVQTVRIFARQLYISSCPLAPAG